MTAPTQGQIQTWLDEALAASHLLFTGEAVVSMTQAGRTVTYSQANRSELAAYIESLEALLNPTAPKPARTFRMTQSGTGY